jgi:hypothetical protein
MPALSLLAAAFLVLLACLGWVALRVFAARNDKGELTAPGCLNGCAFAVVLAGLGAVGLGTLVVGAFVAATPPEVRETFRDVRHELSGAFTDMREELRGAADELNDELREAAEELRRELPGERNDARPRGPEWTRRRESESSAPLAAPVVDGWPVRLVVRWRGEANPPLELLEALVGCGLVEPIDIAVESSADETDETEQRATFHARAAGGEFAELERCLREALEQARETSGTSFELLEAQREDLR